MNLLFIDVYEKILDTFDTTGIDHSDAYNSVGIATIFIVLLLPIVYYLVICNKTTKFSERKHWVYTLIINFILVFLITFGITSTLVPDAVNSFVLVFSLINAIISLIIFFIASIVLKRWSTNGIATPF